MEQIKELILEESKKGNVIISSFEGLAKMKLSEIVDQPVEGLLYDLNRDPATILTFIKDPKWVNDYACMQVIQFLHEKVNQLQFELDYMRDDKKAMLSDMHKMQDMIP